MVVETVKKLPANGEISRVVVYLSPNEAAQVFQELDFVVCEVDARMVPRLKELLEKIEGLK